MRVSVAPAEVDLPQSADEVTPEKPWLTLVWNDPVNLMSYVTYVFEHVFGYTRPKAEKLMLDVHHKGKARRGQRYPRGHGAQRRGAARLRPVGDRAGRTHEPSRSDARCSGPLRAAAPASGCRAGEATLLRTLVAPVTELLNDPAGPARRASTRRPGRPSAAGESSDLFDDLEKMFNETAAAPETPDDPVLARLLPDAYQDDPEAAGEFRKYTESVAARGQEVLRPDAARDAPGQGRPGEADRPTRPGTGCGR